MWRIPCGQKTNYIHMKENVLITGGAGFIGSHLTDRLISQGYSVKILDNLNEQIHGKGKRAPDYLNSNAELIVGDIRDKDAVKLALENVDIVYHFASIDGIEPSMLEIRDYIDVNDTGTAVLLEELIKKPVRKLIVASSMSIYGEGLYRGPNKRNCEGKERSYDQLKAQDWELYNRKGSRLIPVPTPEHKSPAHASIYALSKYNQEKLCMMIGQAYSIPTIILRFFNVYGTRQSLLNPYAGVLANFASALVKDNSPVIYEDGLQQRDFLHVKDAITACILAAEMPAAIYKTFNIGSGSSYTISEIANRIIKLLGKEGIYPQITGKYRLGDVRHCFGDISYAKRILGYTPKVTIDEGLTELLEWIKGQKVAELHNHTREELFT